MKKRLAFIFLMILMVACFPFISNDTRVVEASIGTTPTVKYSSTLSSTYYSSVEGKTGDALLEGLASLTLQNHKYYTTYEEIKGGNAYSDRDPNNSSKLIDFYTGWSIPNDWDGGSTWNREHVWAQSLSNNLFGEDGAGSDIHHIRPLISSINSARNNGLFTDTEHCGSIPLSKYYYTGTKVPSHTGEWTGCYTYNQDYWEPRDNEKGDVARILLYLYTHYSKEVSANSSNSRAGNLLIQNIAYTSKKTADAAFDMLVEWNELDPVSTFESNRNNYCASVTGVRNPYIDHPEYVNAIWGDGTSSGGSSSGDSSDSGSTGDSGSSSGNSGNSGSSTGGTTTETITTTTYKQLKSANGITVGSKIIIAAKDYSYAMSTEQKTKNRGQTAISKYTSGSDAYLIPSSSTQILEVKSKDSSTGGYSLYTGSGYLAATSSDENLLTTKSSLGSGKNAYWKINFSSGAANIVSAGSYTRNTIRYNATSSLFSCYDTDNSQKDVAIYKQYTETTTIVVPTPGTGGNETPSYEYPDANSLLTINKAIEVANAAGTSFTADKYQIQGTIESVESSTYGNMYIKDEEGNSIYVYGVYSSDGTVRYDSLNPLPQVGDKITLLGILGVYNSTPEMKSGWIVDLETAHTHTIEVTYDESNHYEVCSECNETISSNSHSFTSSTTLPTCTSKGFTTYSCNCGYSYTSDEKEALNHSYDEPTYIWNEDYSECTATRVCKNDLSHKEVETVNSIITKSEASCGVAGSIVYTATFTNEAFKTQTYSEVIDALSHDYSDPIYIWNEDYSECVAKRVCTHDSSHVETEIAKVSIIKEDASCGRAGQITYTATFTNEAFKTQTHVQEIEALFHKYGDVIYNWSEDYTSCTATRICEHDSHHVETETVKSVINETSASCETDGTITYTAAFTNEAFKTQTHSEKVESLGHKYGDVIYNWSEDYTSCTALRICENDSRHVETETVKASIEKVEAECEKEGSITYTAVFTNDAFKTQTHVDIIEAKSHEYSEVVYTWNRNHTECTASRTCKNNLNHIEVETVKATIETIDAVCGEAGSVTYTANFENVVFETQTYQETVETLDHIYGEASYNWNEDYTKCTATAVCLLDSNHVYSETVDVTSNIINPTCEEDGSITYTAVFENAIFATQTYVEKIDSLSHSYGEVEYIWNEDYTKCTASMTCSLDTSHVHGETVDVSVSTIESTCEEEGSITYTAVFESEEFETQTYVEIIKEKGHEYDEGVITKEATEDEEGEMTYTCSHCGHSYVESIEKLPPSIEEPPLEEEPIVPEPDLGDEIDNNKGEEVAIVTTAVTVSSVSLGGALWFVFKFLIKLK